jgi:hypothetical protein
MFESGEIISYRDMCDAERASLQRGMNYKHRGQTSVLLMSVRRGAPYRDRVDDDGRVLIYEGHDVKKTDASNPKKVDQPMVEPSGKLTQNGQFWQAVERFKSGSAEAETVSVYEKIKTGIWVFNGSFKLVDAWQEDADGRKVFKFRLELESREARRTTFSAALEHQRIIPSSVKVGVWKRDKGQCVKCGSKDNLHFDHIIPFSQGGSSLVAENIQLMCARHNIQKRDKLE